MQNYYDVGFDTDQQQEITAGLKESLDISYYAKPELMAIQMRQIRLGLREGIDVTVYNRPEYDWFQMEELRKGIQANIKYQLYANPKIDYKTMRQVRLGLEQGIDLSAFIKLEAGKLEELRKAIISKVNIVEYIKEGYGVHQLAEIREALEKKQNIRPYITPELLAPSIREISLGLESGLPVEEYATDEYSWQQMREIRLGMENRVDVTMYNSSLYSWQQMRELRLGLEDGLDISSYKRFSCMASDMEKIRKKLLLEDATFIVTHTDSSISDKVVHIFVSTDEMEACLELDCNQDTEITEAEIKKHLRLHGVVHGVLDNVIKEVVQQKKYRQTIVVAKGTEPVIGEDGYYEFFFNTSPDHSPKILEDGTADFKNINWCVLVKQKEKIAYYHEPTDGHDGKTITGQVLKGKRGKEMPMISGNGFVLLADKKTYIAAIDGKIQLVGDHRIEITRVYLVDDVNLSTGNINFDGTVYVLGNVERGASIYATEDVVVNGFVEAAFIRADRDICLHQGVNGNGFGKIEAKGNIVGQFFEATTVVAGQDINAHYCMNCEMQAAGQVIIYGNRGLLLGGYTRAARGIQAYDIGNRVGLVTLLNVGIDNKSMNDMWAIETQIKNVDKELKILNNSYQDFKNKYAPEVRNTMEIYIKIENAIYTKALQRKELVTEREQLDIAMKEMMNAKVVIGGTLYEGVQITVDNILWRSFMIKDVTVHCRQGKVVAESN